MNVAFRGDDGATIRTISGVEIGLVLAGVDVADEEAGVMMVVAVVDNGCGVVLRELG